MSRAPYETAARAVLVAALGLAEEAVVFANHGGPKPTGAWAMVDVQPPSPIGGSEQTLTDTPSGDDFVLEVDTHHAGLVEVQLFGDGHRSRMLDLIAVLSTPAIAELEQTLGLSVSPSSGRDVLEVAVPQVTSFERRTVKEFAYSFKHTLNTTAGAIEGADLTNNAA